MDFFKDDEIGIVPDVMIALYPGSFDPLTLGHKNIIERFSVFFSKLIILIAKSHEKKALFSLEERKKMTSLVFKNTPHILVDSFDGLTVNYAKKVRAKVILRGLRAISDFEREIAIANINQFLYPSIETLILPACPKYSFVSSKIVKEVAAHGGNLKDLVPKEVEKALRNKFKEQI